MKIVDQNWGCEEYRIECSAYMNTCIDREEPESYWSLYRAVMEEGADNLFNRIFRDSNELPQNVKDGLQKVVRYMEYSQNIAILNPN